MKESHKGNLLFNSVDSMVVVRIKALKDVTICGVGLYKVMEPKNLKYDL